MDPRLTNPPYESRETLALRDVSANPDAGLVAQGAAQVRDILGDVTDLTQRLEKANDRLLGPEPKEASPGAPGVGGKPFSDVDALAQNIVELRRAVARLHMQIVRTERL